jgi:hypothetical protein
MKLKTAFSLLIFKNKLLYFSNKILNIKYHTVFQQTFIILKLHFKYFNIGM